MASLALRSQLNTHVHRALFSQLLHLENDTQRAKFNGAHLKLPQRTNFKVVAVAELEEAVPFDQNPTSVPFESLGEGLAESEEKEKERRMKISKANKNRVPWNKGRKHSAETIQRIRERTKIAMQNPKVRMKLNFGHRQSKETKMKIGDGVRIGWIRRRKKLKVQETCIRQWQNLIAEASKGGLHGEEEELQWDSYKTLGEQLEREWLASVEERRAMRRPKGVRRSPMSPEQKRKIAEAIVTKWTDPKYRDRVCTGMAKYHGTPAGSQKKSQRSVRAKMLPTKQNLGRKKSNDSVATSSSSIRSGQSKPLSVWRSNKQLYRDHLASSKLEMIMNIRAQRAAAESEIDAAVDKARLLITEAEEAAKALEHAAVRSPSARASLMETRKLIAEAVQLIGSVETGHGTANGTGSKEDIPNKEIVNGGQAAVSSNKMADFDFNKFTLQNLLNDGQLLLPRNSTFALLSMKGEMKSPNSREQGYDHIESNVDLGKVLLPNVTQTSSSHSKPGERQPKSVSTRKKWVRGRLIEVTDTG